MRRILILTAVVTPWMMVAQPAQASFPGTNGKIAFQRGGDIWTMNPDGTSQVNLTNDAACQERPAWSPDGTRIAYAEVGSGDCNSGRHIATMAANGSDRLTVPLSGDDLRAPGWSPDGVYISYLEGYVDEDEAEYVATLLAAKPDGTSHPNGIWAYNAAIRGGDATDWSPSESEIAYVQSDFGPDIDRWLAVSSGPAPGGVRYLTPNCCERVDSMSWSPNATRIAYVVKDEPGEGFCRLESVPSGGGQKTSIFNGTTSAAYCSGVAWSPDATQIAFSMGGQLRTIKPDGTGVSGVVATDVTRPSWQPILRGYARPKAASPFYASLVPAYEPCTTPNRTHAAPLSFGSCNPPAQTSAFATVGTPDANAQPAKSVGALKLVAIGEVPINTGNGNQSDLEIDLSVTDVRQKATPASDYTAGMRASVALQITDRNNTPHPGGPGPGTVAPLSFEFDVPCAATPDTTVGATCSVDTTANALVPGQVLERQRAIWQLGVVELFDGGTDGNPSTTADNTLFATQGVFIP